MILVIAANNTGYMVANVISFHDPRFKEVCCLLFFDGQGLFGEKAIERWRNGGKVKQLITRGEFILMSQMDLDDKWYKYATETPTLIIKAKCDE